MLIFQGTNSSFMGVIFAAPQYTFSALSMILFRTLSLQVHVELHV